MHTYGIFYLHMLVLEPDLLSHVSGYYALLYHLIIIQSVSF